MNFKRLGWLVLCLCWLTPVSAKTIQPVIKLVAIQQEKSTEYISDRVYISISEYDVNHQLQHYNIPELPNTWSAAKLNKIHQVTLWQKALKPGQRVELVIALVEHDMEPWNADDVVGAVKLRLFNDDGKLKAVWKPYACSTDAKETKVADGVLQRFVLTGDGGRYTIDLQLTNTQ